MQLEERHVFGVAEEISESNADLKKDFGRVQKNTKHRKNVVVISRT